MKKKFQMGFVDDSDSKQDWAVYLDGVSIAQFSLDAHSGTSKYVNVELADNAKIQLTVSATGDAAADVTRKGDKLVLTSKTPGVWELEQETGSQYLVKSTLDQGRLRRSF